jgi:hypothetical protein
MLLYQGKGGAPGQADGGPRHTPLDIRMSMMRAQDFLFAVRDRCTAALPEALRGHHARVAYGTLQIHFGNPRVHYEVWLVRKTGRIEVGLHFEGEREDNERAALTLARRVHEIRAIVGDDIELEQWTASWTRLHLTLPLGPLIDESCDEVARRLARLIAATHEAAMAPVGSTPRTSSGRRFARGNRRRSVAGAR